MEKTRKFQIVYVGLTNICQHSTTDLARGIMTNEHRQSALSKARSFKHSKTTSSFSYSIYHQQAGKTSLFHMRGVEPPILILAVPLSTPGKQDYPAPLVSTRWVGPWSPIPPWMARMGHQFSTMDEDQSGCSMCCIATIPRSHCPFYCKLLCQQTPPSTQRGMLNDSYINRPTLARLDPY